MVRWKTLSRWRPERKEFLAPLSVPSPCADLLSGFPRGVDNVRVDVLLSKRFVELASEWVRTLLQQRLGELHQWNGEPFGSTAKDLEHRFREAYVALQQVAIERARNESAPRWLDLFHIVVFSFLRELPGREHERVRKRLTRMLGMGVSGTNEHALTLNERLLRLAAYENSIRYYLARAIFRPLFKLEVERLRKARKSVLGRSWQIPRDCLFNPLLQLPDFHADSEFMRHYPLCFSDPDHGEELFATLERLVCDLFADYLPDEVCASVAEAIEDADPTTLGYLVGAYSKEELFSATGSWLDEPDNFWLLVGRPEKGRRVRPSLIRVYSAAWHDRRWPEYQAALRKSMLRRLGPVKNLLLAAQQTPEVLNELEQPLPPRMIYLYLAGLVGRKDLASRIESLTVGSPQPLWRELDQARRRLRRLSSEQRSSLLLRGVEQFLCLRRDGKRALQFLHLDKGIQRLERSDEVMLSRANGVLQELLFEDELRGQSKSVRSHVIIKADLRGSSAIIARLVGSRLNPATYFSLNFFNPITRLVEELGGEKVFVEGDAVILAVIEYEGVGSRRQAVAHACLLAKKILEVVDRKNIGNRKHGLPELEVGLGIAYSDVPPTYLYDGDRPIMISSAIHRSDRLSSCHADVRRRLFPDRGRGIEVVEPPRRRRMESKADSENLLRYNVNGIELDAPAFFKLKNELVLRRFEARDPSRDTAVRLYAGRFTDRAGGIHWLVVREAPVRVWTEEGQLLPDEKKRNFYEVVTDPELITQARRRMRSPRGSDKQPLPASDD